MIESIALLGHLENSKYAGNEIASKVQNCYKENSKGEQRLVEINLLLDEQPVFNEVIVRDLRPDHSVSILYRGGSGTGPNPAPSAFQTDKDTLTIKIFAFFKKALALQDLDEVDKQWLAAVYNELQRAKPEIRAQLDDIIAKKGRHDSLILTVSFTKDDTVLYLADTPLFVQLFERFCIPPNASIGTCSVCGKKNVEVMPASTTQTYKFFNLDKSGFFWELADDQAYAAFPICIDCLQDIENGKRYIVENLNFRFVDVLSYHLIPQFFTNEEESVKKFVRVVKGEDVSQDIGRVVKQEEAVLHNLGRLNDTVAINLLFIDTSGGKSAEKISALVQDVYPSRLRTIYDAKFIIDDMYENVFPEKLPKDKFSFSVVRDFFPRKSKYQKPSKSAKGFTEYFLYVVQSIFENRPLDRGFVFRSVMHKVEEEFHAMLAGDNKEYFMPTMKEAEMLVSYLLELGLLSGGKEENMEQNQLFDDYFMQFKTLYDSSLKRGLFLLGAAVHMLADMQTGGARGEVAPILRELKSLRMNLADFQGLLAKIQQKAFEYTRVAEPWQINRINKALESASRYLLYVDKTNMTLQEMNFYFVAGYHQGRDISMYIGNKLKEFKEQQGDKEDDINE